ncbi:hypothetical protein ABB37_04609 [Leptomonas pyrrhocoris]|uniref:Uncharacterized protein n=1 Tax=Leptomonas pyrrhocoris TaxID=157538 RepID=A0A0M9G1M5_LEPPY|nr:hypothetical protein ABB37_04609 [Leptomonas pyrrhocoris]XP_015658779.1 hypothetical protein ABB37_04609 [Leptomonas pyrrhocoris]KPA80339.1 hypothetical protein ABB37_04609 [Leptomonas pyrrhocoris]KPA80340.1 hypothetical protein ABB37_04609 [Leptomonas pyrrhocoris]|eukprot:XP_015658778.1 hypothetical protein ABB37_04609 [Leptomonas pyrrhocoris]
MADVRQSDDAATCPRLFSVLGGAVTRASLQQLQRDIDVMMEVPDAPTSTRSASPTSHNAPAKRTPSVQSWRRVLEALRAARTNTDDADASASTSATDVPAPSASSAPPTQLLSPHGSAASVRDTLVHLLGVSTGSALYRECVAAPRRRVRHMVKQLAQAVRTQYLRRLSLSEPVDVHVQLYPSAAEASCSAVPAALRENKGFCAAITVRRLADLADEAAAGQRLKERYMNVAAQGQTLASALAFWADVSYGDAPPAALAEYPPLGFEAEDSVNGAAPLTRTGTTMSTTEDDGRRLGQKATRPTRVGEEEAGDEVASSSLLLGLPERRQQLVPDPSGRPTWMQPSLLSSPSTAAKGGRSSADSRQGAALPHLSYSPVGLVAVLYVHSSGVAYVGYPPAPQGREEDSEADTSSLPTAVTPIVAARPPLVCTLPMLSSTGFTRSLLGLS